MHTRKVRKVTKFPSTREEYFKAIARETARMSYPGRMGGVLVKDTKKDEVERYFVEQFPLQRIWDNPSEIAHDFDKWHDDRVSELAEALNKRLNKERNYNSKAVAAKLLNTFMYQLMKYKKFRPLWKELHLPLDRITLKSLWSLSNQYQSLKDNKVKKILKKYKGCPYQLKYEEYREIQRALLELINEIKSPFKLTSRIELNLLWAEPSHSDATSE